MKRKIAPIALVVLSGFVLICSCTKGYNTSSSSAAMPMSNGGNMTMMVNVTIQNSGFMPDTLRITTGTTVMWSNMDSMMHTITDAEGMLDSGNIAPGMSFQYTFASMGTYNYYTMPNTMMKGGVVIVSN